MPDAKGLVAVACTERASLDEQVAKLAVKRVVKTGCLTLRASALLSNIRALLEPSCPALSARGSASRQ